MGSYTDNRKVAPFLGFLSVSSEMRANLALMKTFVELNLGASHQALYTEGRKPREIVYDCASRTQTRYVTGFLGRRDAEKYVLN